MSLTLHELDTIQAARLLHDAIEKVHQAPEYRSVWASYHNHGGVYVGPNYHVELANLKASIGAMDLNPAPPPSPPTPAVTVAPSDPEPYPVCIHASGGSTGIHDYRMSDGSIRTLSESEAETLVIQSRRDNGIAQIEAYKVSWQKGQRRGSKVITDHGEAMDYYKWRSASSNNAPVLIEPLIVPLVQS